MSYQNIAIGSGTFKLETQVVNISLNRCSVSSFKSIIGVAHQLIQTILATVKWFIVVKMYVFVMMFTYHGNDGHSSDTCPQLSSPSQRFICSTNLFFTVSQGCGIVLWKNRKHFFQTHIFKNEELEKYHTIVLDRKHAKDNWKSGLCETDKRWQRRKRQRTWLSSDLKRHPFSGFSWESDLSAKYDISLALLHFPAFSVMCVC